MSFRIFFGINLSNISSLVHVDTKVMPFTYSIANGVLAGVFFAGSSVQSRTGISDEHGIFPIKNRESCLRKIDSNLPRSVLQSQ